MKISKREKTLLVFLLIALLFFGYYWLFIKPLEQNVISLRSEVEMKRNEQQLVLTKLKTSERITAELETLTKSISEKSVPYYTALTQEEMMMRALALRTNQELSFTKFDYIPDDDNDPLTTNLSAKIGINGDYFDLMAYIRNIEAFDKKIIIKKIALTSNNDGILSGEMELEFCSVKDIAPYIAEDETLVTLNDNYRDDLMHSFIPFDGFAFVDNLPLPSYPDQEETVDYTNYRPKIQIYGFEDGSNFFVSSSEETSGQVIRSQTKVAGGYSTEMTFDFITAREVNEANLVFDTNPVMIQKQAEYLGLWTYAYEFGNHAIGAVLIDATGKEYRVALTDNVDWIGWKELEVLLPVEINYPCKVQRIYVEGIGYDQKINGKYLFDQLQISYPIEQGGN